MSTIQLQSARVPFIGVPRGAQWAGDAAAALFAAVRAAFLRQPVSAAQSRQMEAESVRRMADQVRATDPGFAEDLYAAASRHEAGE